MEMDNSHKEYRRSLFANVASNLRIRAFSVQMPVKYNRDFPDLGLRSVLFGGEKPFLEELPAVQKKENRMQVWMIQDTFRCHYFMGTDEEQGNTWLIGPYIMEDIKLNEINRICTHAGLKNADIQYMRQYYHTLPIIRDDNLMYAIIHSHCTEVYGPEGFDLLFWEMTFSKTPEAVESRQIQTEYLRDTVEYTYAQEAMMMRSISAGNRHGAKNAIRKMGAKGLEARTTSTIRDLKNFSIVFNTLCRIAAEEGGARAWDIDQYSRKISIQIENSSSVGELKMIRENMLDEYCSMVRKARQPQYSALILQMTDLIEARFSENLTLSVLADELNHSPNYLSLRFKKETGKSFSEYLAETRIAYGRQLLEDTDLSVAAVAGDCGIPDNNYFSRLFRQKEGKTPKEYRAEHRNRKAESAGK